MADQPVVLNLPPEVLRATVEAALLKSMPPEVQGRMVSELIHSILSVKVRNPTNYREETVVENVIATVMREEALRTFRAWMDEQRPVIAKGIQAELKRRGTADKIMASIMDSLTNVHISLSLGDGR